MKIALYGMPCAGKTTLLERIEGARILHGSQELKRICGHSFNELSEEEKREIRIRYTEYVNGLSDDLIISDGHYSFVDDVVYTDADGELYDVFMYLYCDPVTLLERYNMSEKNNRFANYSVEIIKEWQEYEIRSLRYECHKRNKDFYVISDNDSAECVFFDFIKFICEGYSSYGYATELYKKIMERHPMAGKLCVVDGDKTIIKQDSYRFCCEGKTGVFDGDFYTGYQSYLFMKVLCGIDINASKVSEIEVNEEIYNYICDKSYIILSSGISKLWRMIADEKGLKSVFSNPLISADVKFFVTKLLRENGYYIEAYGDSKIDLYMLREADEGTLFIGDRISRSLKNESLDGIKLSYNKKPDVLTEYVSKEVLKDIAICKSDSGISGGTLAAAHFRLGVQVAKRMAVTIPCNGTALVVLERGGRFFGDGIYTEFGGTFYSYNPAKDTFPEIKEKRIVIIDSVINTGKSIVKIIDVVKEQIPEIDIYIASNVIQKDALQLFSDIKIYAVRVSENSFVGKNQAKQVGKTGPDTADRLYNLIEKRFDLL